MSRGRPRKYRTKKESKAAKKTHTKQSIPLHCTLIEVGMSERKQDIVGPPVPSRFLNWRSLRTCSISSIRRHRVKGRVHVHDHTFLPANLKKSRMSTFKDWKQRCSVHPERSSILSARWKKTSEDISRKKALGPTLHSVGCCNYHQL